MSKPGSTAEDTIPFSNPLFPWYTPAPSSKAQLQRLPFFNPFMTTLHPVLVALISATPALAHWTVSYLWSETGLCISYPSLYPQFTEPGTVMTNSYWI